MEAFIKYLTLTAETVAPRPKESLGAGQGSYKEAGEAYCRAGASQDAWHMYTLLGQHAEAEAVGLNGLHHITNGVSLPSSTPAGNHPITRCVYVVPHLHGTSTTGGHVPYAFYVLYALLAQLGDLLPKQIETHRPGSIARLSTSM